MERNTNRSAAGFWPLIRAGRGGITSAKLTKEYGPGAALSINAEISCLGGGKSQAPYFSVTCDVRRSGRTESEREAAGGCMHELALKYWPELAPIVALHLASARDGSPMHAEANGWYSLAGFFECGERYTAANSPRHFPKAELDPAKPWQTTDYRNPTPAECLGIFAEHIRVEPKGARALVERIRAAALADVTPCSECKGSGLQRAGLACYCGGDGIMPWRNRLKGAWGIECDAMRPRWSCQARDGLLFMWQKAAPPDLRNEWAQRVYDVLGVNLLETAPGVPA